MPESNKSLLKRADAEIADLVSNGGILPDEEADTFIDLVIEQPTILSQSRFVRMQSHTMKLNRIGFGSRILHAAPQGTPPYAADDGTNSRYLLAANRSKPTTTQISLTTEEMMAEVHLPYEYLEDNIEGESLRTHILRLIAERLALDLEETALWSDTTSADPDLALFDGWLARMTSNTYDNLSAGITPDVFAEAQKALPQKYLRYMQQMRGYISHADRISFQQAVATRATGYGDSALKAIDTPLYAYSLQLEAAPLLNAGAGLAAETAFMTFPKNLIFGIRRDISFEMERDIRAREWIIVVTCRIGTQLDEEEATVKIINM